MKSPGSSRTSDVVITRQELLEARFVGTFRRFPSEDQLSSIPASLIEIERKAFS